MPLFGSTWPRQKSDRPLNAQAINRPAAELARLSGTSIGTGLASINIAGTDHTYSTRRKPFLIRITSVGTSTQAGSYGWQAIASNPASPGTYIDLAGWAGALGSDAFFEYNGNTQLKVGDRLEVTREFESQEIRAQFDHC